jgi:hypothetical protein
MLRALCLTLVALPPLAACAPIPLDQAERLCAKEAREAQRPRGKVGLGIGSGGKPASTLDVTISTDFLLGRDPAQVYDACVKARSGQFPSRAWSDVMRG